MEQTMTKSAKKLLGIAYREYLNRQKTGTSKKQAKYFSSSDTWRNHFSDISLADYRETVSELCRATGSNYYSGGSFELRDNAIVYMENRFSDNAKELGAFIAQFI